ncbi:uncharacterized protein TNCV_4435191 [Trichonephila clavipes]|nr:uncharacterized protein TNCV_4435191 [Trichonephila clavipes]
MSADIADRILKVSLSPFETFAVSHKKQQTLESKLFREIEKLNERIDRLSISSGRSPYPTRGLLATDHVILNHGQVTWTTPELAPPLLTTTPHQREDVSALDRFSVHRCPTRRVFSGTGLELVTKPATIRCLYHSATAATMHLGHLRPSKSNYAAPLHMIFKKGISDWRPVGGYRALNSHTLKDKYSIPCNADFNKNPEFLPETDHNHLDKIVGKGQL